MADLLASYLNFMWAGLLKGGQTGALVPSGRFLVDKMIAPVPADYRGEVVELGAGNGALTRRLAARCPRARVLACEINPVLARDTAEHIADAGLSSRVEVISDAAENVLPALRRRGKGKVDYVISGIPLGNLKKERVFGLIDAICRSLSPGGMYIQFQYSLLDRNKIKARFLSLRTVPVFLNLPPAVVYYAQK
jgi:phosphatidylethanolamine/phosphatidyl-N-methylethanolamine N-methyltransferase